MSDFHEIGQSTPSDEVLMAYADGELSSEERARVERAIARHPELRERVAIFTATRDPLQRAFAPILAAPVPDRLLAAIATAPMPSTTLTTSHKTSLKTNGAPTADGLMGWLTSRWPLNLSPAFALGLALLIGAGIGAAAIRIFGSSGPTGALVGIAGHGIKAQGALASALDRSAAGVPVTTGTTTITPVLTFRTQAGSYCRQYEVRDGGTSGFAGYACRDAGGQWRIEMLVERTASLTTAPGTYRPASGGVSPALEAAISNIIDGDALTSEAEAQLIARGWKR